MAAGTKLWGENYRQAEKNSSGRRGWSVYLFGKKYYCTGKSRVFDPAWKNYKSIVLSETAGISRTAEPVEVLLPFYPDEAKDLKRIIRVV